MFPPWTHADPSEPDAVFYKVKLGDQYFRVRYSDVNKAHTTLLGSQLYREALKGGQLYPEIMPRMPDARKVMAGTKGLSRKQKDNRAKGIRAWFDQLIMLYDTRLGSDSWKEMFREPLDTIRFCGVDGCQEVLNNPLRRI